MGLGKRRSLDRAQDKFTVI